MADIYVVQIGSASIGFSITSLESVESLLQNATSVRGANEVATILAKSYDGTVLAVVPASYKYAINLVFDSYGWTWKAKVTDVNGSLKYNGTVRGMTKALTTPDWNEYVGKVVKFTYEGGSTPHGTRLFKVREFVKTNNTFAGIDLEKEQPRNFDVTKIKNLKVVAN